MRNFDRYYDEPFDAEQNEIEYEDAMTEPAATVERLAAELAAANAKIADQAAAIKNLQAQLLEDWSKVPPSATGEDSQ